uniref:ATP synthase F0 subunit 8 n=1 Tax=Hypsicera sp. ZJUH_2016019 TaxID=2491161 RepID=A0A3S8V0V5_9HYME|nr:ATP synthase F0 subunit 8 [Hypsicera sp. ZJUH_2016019]
MPQMAPYNWLILNIFFSFILIFLSTLIYFIMPMFFNKNFKLSKLQKKINLTW